MCAGVAVGYFDDLDDAVMRTQRIIDETHPSCENTVKYQQLFIKYKKIGKFLKKLNN